MLQDSKHCFWHVVHDYVQIDLVWLISLGIESMFQSNNVGMIELLHYLQFSVLVPFILIHLLDCHLFVVLVHCGLENHTKRSISNNTIGVVGETSWLLILFLSGFVCLFIHF